MKRKAPGPTARARAAKLRKDMAVAKKVREAVSWRDRYCRLYLVQLIVGNCAGVSEWAHLHSHQRSKTLGQASEIRHTEDGSVMLCTRHHRDYDAKQFELEPVTPASGARGLLRVMPRGSAVAYEATV